MKIIYGGGWNNELKESIQSSFVLTYQNVIKKAVQNGKKIAFVTLAKPDGYYDYLLFPRYKGIIDIIDSTTQTVSWEKYDGIFIPYKVR